MNKYWFYKVGLVVVFLCFALLGEAKVKLPTLVSDGMVFQCGESVSIWGTADPDETVGITSQKRYLMLSGIRMNRMCLTEWNDIHPLDKKTLGQRVSQAVFQQRVK